MKHRTREADYDNPSSESNKGYQGRHNAHRMQRKGKNKQNHYFNRNDNNKRDSSYHGTKSKLNPFEMFSNYILQNDQRPSGTKRRFSSIFPTQKPRHIIEGIVSCFHSIFVGISMAFLSIISIPLASMLRSIHNRNIEDIKWISVLVGVIQGSMYGSTFLLVGVMNGLYQAIRGMVHTPHAIDSINQGMIWDDNTETWKFYYLQDELDELRSYQPFLDPNRYVKNHIYYDILNVPLNADAKEIKRAYYRKAKVIHPDKNLGHNTSSDDEFHILHEAYLTLSDTNKRMAYDTWGYASHVGERDNDAVTGVPEFDANVFFSILLNVKPVEGYIGNLTIASFTNQAMYLIRSGGEQSPEELLKLIWNYDILTNNESRMRQVRIALFLNDRVSSYISGKQTIREFQKSCHQEAQNIAVGPFGWRYLYAIGTALNLQSKHFLKFHSISFGWLESATFWVKKKKETAKAMVAMSKEFIEVIKVIKSNNLTSGAMVHIDQNTLDITLPKIMDIAWEVIKLDIFATISQSCQRLFADSNINSRYKRFERAEAIQIMSLEFLNLAKYEMDQVNLEREENSRDDILSRIEVAIEISLLQASNFDIPVDIETKIKNHKPKNRVLYR